MELADSELLSKRRACAYKANAPMPPTAARSADEFWRSLGQTPTLNLGTVFGTSAAMLRLLDAVGAELQGRGTGCWDQGVLNVLVWTSAIAATRVVVWE